MDIEKINIWLLWVLRLECFILVGCKCLFLFLFVFLYLELVENIIGLVVLLLWFFELERFFFGFFMYLVLLLVELYFGFGLVLDILIDLIDDLVLFI